jgi:hypothetical protein
MTYDSLQPTKKIDSSVMLTWFQYEQGRWLFRFNIDDVIHARQAAFCCNDFMEDDDDEMVDDQLRSCFNCMMRRWLVNSFECRGLC